MCTRFALDPVVPTEVTPILWFCVETCDSSGASLLQVVGRLSYPCRGGPCVPESVQVIPKVAPFETSGPHLAWTLTSRGLLVCPCSNKGINNMTTRCLWFLQTFLFGFASLGLLLKYKPERRKKN